VAIAAAPAAKTRLPEPIPVQRTWDVRYTSQIPTLEEPYASWGALILLAYSGCSDNSDVRSEDP
jgi:hypothetical protein